MKNKRKLESENQKSKNIMGSLTKSSEHSLQINISNTNFPNCLLLQNSAKGPPGRSRSPGSGKDQSGAQ